MVKLLAVVSVAGLLPLLGCASSALQPVPAAPATPSAAALTIDTPVATVFANPAGKAVLDKDLPGLTTDPNYGFFKFMSLRTLQSMSGGKMTQAQLQQVQGDLARIPPAP